MIGIDKYYHVLFSFLIFCSMFVTLREVRVEKYTALIYTFTVTFMLGFLKEKFDGLYDQVDVMANLGGIGLAIFVLVMFARKPR